MSADCSYCKRSISERKWDNSQASTIRSCRVTIGSDWEMLARILNYTGANGTDFCPFCDIMLKHMIKGIPHTPTILPKYKVKDTKVVKEYTLRTLQDLP